MNQIDEMMSFNFDFKSTDVYSFQIVAFPPTRPKFSYLQRCFNQDRIVFYEDRYGGIHLESTCPLLEAEVTLPPINWIETNCARELTITYNGLGFKNYIKKDVLQFAYDVSSMIPWKHKIVFETDKGQIEFWKSSGNNNRSVSKDL